MRGKGSLSLKRRVKGEEWYGVWGMSFGVWGSRYDIEIGSEL